MFKQISRLFLVLLFSASFNLQAQVWFQRNDSVKVFTAGSELLNPWAGGFNSTMFSSIDLDQDGVKDLVAFDKGSAKLRCFLNTGSAGFSRYKHAPQFEPLFPALMDWVLLKDYNNDGKEDIFMYWKENGMDGIRVWKNISTVTGGLQFLKVYQFLNSDYNPSGTPNVLRLYTAGVGFPGIEDIDNDGDLDILTFSVFGSQVEFHQNRTVELGLPADSIRMFMIDDCWGDFSEGTCTSNLNVCPLFKMWQSKKIAATADNLHAGSCILCFDNDGDGDKDLLLGDITCDSIDFFRNGNTASNAHVDSVSKTFPASKPVKMYVFPCGYYLDTDNDGKRDLIISPTTTSASENFESTWHYKNVGTDASPVFSYLENNFLQDSMLDFGEGASPMLADENGDGLLDILVGNFGYYASPSSLGKIALLRNTGTASSPQFTLMNRNYGNFSTLVFRDLAPAFGDLDGDGDLDLLIGEFDGKLAHYQNLAGPGNPFNFSFVTAAYKSIDVGQDSKPQLIDVDRDGVLDLLVGARNGKINYFRNTGTTSSAIFSSTATSTFFGGVKVTAPNYITGYAAPFMIDVNGSYELFVGSERGYLYHYANIDSNLTGNFTLIDSVAWDIWLGGKIASCIGHIDNDGYPDMIIGNYDGGLAYFAGVDPSISIKGNSFAEILSIYPNPANSELTVSFADKIIRSRNIEVFDISGRSLFAAQTNYPTLKINCQDFPAGIYFLRYRDESGVNGSKRFLISK